MDALFGAAALSMGGGIWNMASMPPMPSYTSVPQGQVSVSDNPNDMSYFSGNVSQILSGATGTMPDIPSDVSSSYVSQADQAMEYESNFDQQLEQMYDNPTQSTGASSAYNAQGFSVGDTGYPISPAAYAGGPYESAPQQPPNPYYGAQLSGGMTSMYSGLQGAFSGFPMMM